MNESHLLRLCRVAFFNIFRILEESTNTQESRRGCDSQGNVGHQSQLNC
jgi:hypothetical protein